MRIEEIFEIVDDYPSWHKIGKIKLYKQIRKRGFVLLSAEVHKKQEVHFWKCWDNEFGGGRSVRHRNNNATKNRNASKMKNKDTERMTVYFGVSMLFALIVLYCALQVLVFIFKLFAYLLN